MAELSNHIELNRFTPRLTPDILLEANSSRAVIDTIDTYQEAKLLGLLIGVDGCADARNQAEDLTGTFNIATNPSIAASYSKDRFQYLFKHKGFAGHMTLGHYSGNLLAEYLFPKGCGAHGAKEQLDAKNIKESDVPVHDYVLNRVVSADPVVQTYHSAKEIAKLTKKPVLAAVQDHLQGIIIPTCLFLDGGESVVAPFDHQLFDDPKYLLENFYKNGKIPELDIDQLPLPLQEILVNNRQFMSNYKKDNPDFKNSQLVQNPELIVLSSSIVPPGLRYLGVCNKLNTTFNLSLPFVKEEKNIVGFKASDICDVFNQLHYPISHAATAAGSNDPFYNTGTLLLETSYLKYSKQLAYLLSMQEWMTPWFNRGGQILIGEVKSGRTKMIEKYLVV